MAATLDDVAERRQVVGEIRGGIDERVAHAGLRSEMDHLPERAVRKKTRGRVGIGQVHANEPEGRMAGELREPRFLQADVVIGIEVVDAGDAPSPREQRERRMHPDEACATRHEHGRVGVDPHRTARDASLRGASPRALRAPAPGVAFHGIIAAEVEHARILRGFAGFLPAASTNGERRVSASASTERSVRERGARRRTAPRIRRRTPFSWCVPRRSATSCTRSRSSPTSARTGRSLRSTGSSRADSSACSSCIPASGASSRSRCGSGGIVPSSRRPGAKSRHSAMRCSATITRPCSTCRSR